MERDPQIKNGNLCRLIRGNGFHFPKVLISHNCLSMSLLRTLDWEHRVPYKRHRVKKRGIGIGLLKMISFVVVVVASMYCICLSFSWCIVGGDIGYVGFLHWMVAYIG